MYQCYSCWKEFPKENTRVVGYDGIQLIGWIRSLFGDKSKEITIGSCPHCRDNHFGLIEFVGRKTPETLYEIITLEDDTPT